MTKKDKTRQEKTRPNKTRQTQDKTRKLELDMKTMSVSVFRVIRFII